MAPAENTSILKVYFFLRNTSGAKKPTVPQSGNRGVSSRSQQARPKSINFRVSPSLNITLLGFTSRCMTCYSWRYTNAFANYY